MKFTAALQALLGVAHFATAVVVRGRSRPAPSDQIAELLEDPQTRLDEEAKLSDSDIVKLAGSHVALKESVNVSRTPRQVYIDLGANWANTLRLYEDIGDAAWINKKPWEVYAFEASPFIQPYLEDFTAFLNSQRPRPELTIPPSGSSLALNEYASRYGCPSVPPSATWGSAAWEEMRSCMFRVFRKQLSKLHADPKLSDTGLIFDRLAVADKAPPVSASSRYVSVPAAAGASNGVLNLGAMTPEQMIRGGAVSGPVAGLPEMEVPLVNVVSWLVDHFKRDDYVVVKMDVEGAEFSMLNALLDGGHACLIDVLAIECHAVLGDCNQLMWKLGQHNCIKVLKEGQHGYRGWDHYSGPDNYFPVDPRK